MYPDFQSFFNDAFGINIPWLSLVKTFGFLVSISFFFAGYTLFLELKRKEKLGLIGYSIEEITIGKPFPITDYLLATLYGFIIGYKIIGMFYFDRLIASPDPMSYLFSKKGYLLGGILVAIGFLVTKIIENKKSVLPEPITKTVKTFPSIKVPDMAMIAAIFGFAGAKLFNAFENWGDFLKDPFGSIFSSSGLTFYGGLILATIALYFYAKKLHLNFKLLCDAAAPGLILAYAIGRLGCQVSGDGDWGIYNSAYKTLPTGKVQMVQSTATFDSTIVQYKEHFDRHFNEYKNIPSKFVPQPNYFQFLPAWLFAYSYPHNVNNIGIPIAEHSTNKEYNSMLPSPVFPTPVYEFIAGTCIFFFLWYNRKRWNRPLTMFGVYLILNGLERFFVEQIRVNYKYDWGFLHPTQAEIIAIALVIAGVLLLLTRKKHNQ